MKKIVDYRKLLGVTDTTKIDDIKSVYKGLMKTWHPDKFVENNELREEAEEKSKNIIEAYHFLMSIAPETREQSYADYTLTINSSGILDFEYKSQTLLIKFSDGNTYEYFDVPKAIYVKLVNADCQGRFARRHIYNEFIYRSTKKLVAAQ